MFAKSILGFVTAAVIVHDIATQIQASKAARLYLKASEAYEEEQRVNHAQIEYLCHMINDAGIEITEFDMIALNNLTAE